MIDKSILQKMLEEYSIKATRLARRRNHIAYSEMSDLKLGFFKLAGMKEAVTPDLKRQYYSTLNQMSEIGKISISDMFDRASHPQWRYEGTREKGLHKTVKTIYHAMTGRVPIKSIPNHWYHHYGEALFSISKASRGEI